MKHMEGNEIIFVGNARCYHTMDWYRNARILCAPQRVLFATDLIESEGHVRLINDDDCILPLYNVDWLLLSKQSSFGNFWRNLMKLLAFPFQVLKLRALSQRYPNAVFHAHTMYYMFICWAAKLNFIGTPQGSEILVRPDRSRLYKHFATKSLLAADHITVDSLKMQEKIKKLCGAKAIIVQNGIDIETIETITNNNNVRNKIVSIRAITPLYRINEIFDARSHSQKKSSLTFFYPFWEDEYRAGVSAKFRNDDVDLGRLTKVKMYKLLASTLLAISIPKSDSSPRTVYEAIFCGCCVAVTYNSYVEALPECMRARVFIVDLEDKQWLDKAIRFAEMTARESYKPSAKALKLYDQRNSMRIVADTFY